MQVTAGHQFLGGVAEMPSICSPRKSCGCRAARGAVHRSRNVRGDRLVFDLAVAQFLAGGGERIVGLSLGGHVGASAAIAEEVSGGVEEGLAAAAKIAEGAISIRLRNTKSRNDGGLRRPRDAEPGLRVPGQIGSLPSGLAQAVVEVDAVAGPGAGGAQRAERRKAACR